MLMACSRLRSHSRASRCFWSFFMDKSWLRMMTGSSRGCWICAAHDRRCLMLSTMSDDGVPLA